jgi:hypothetical protein
MIREGCTFFLTLLILPLALKASQILPPEFCNPNTTKILEKSCDYKFPIKWEENLEIGARLFWGFCHASKLALETFGKTSSLAYQKSVNQGRSSKFSLASKQGEKRFETHLFPSLVI